MSRVAASTNTSSPGSMRVLPSQTMQRSGRRSPAVDGDDAHVDVGHAAAASRRCCGAPAAPPATARTAIRLTRPSANSQHLQRLGVLDQLADVARHATPRGRSPRSTAKPSLPSSGLPSWNSGERTRAMRRRHVEHVVRDLAGHEVGLVQRARRRSACRRRRAPASRSTDGLDAVADHAAQVEAVLQLAQALRVGVDDGDVVALGDQALGDAFADAAGAEDEDVQRRAPGRSGSSARRTCLRRSGTRARRGRCAPPGSR